LTLFDTGKAIGEVSRLLQDELETRIADTHNLATIRVTVGRPTSQGANPGSKGPRLNLFLYEVHFDEFLKNSSLNENMPAPAWLVLKYVLTAFDEKEESDTSDSLDLLGFAVQALQSPDLLAKTSFKDALSPNPEILRITFTQSPSDLISKLMQGPDEKYRLSIGFEVRPVLIVQVEPPSIAPLVGVDYSKVPAAEIGGGGIQIPVIPSSIPSIQSIVPSTKLELGSRISIHGDGFSSKLAVFLSSASLPVVRFSPNSLDCIVDQSAVDIGGISAGRQPLALAYTMPSNEQVFGDPCFVDLLPTLITATPHLQPIDPVPTDSPVYGNIKLSGNLLGSKKDDILVVLLQNGVTVKAFKISNPSSFPQQGQNDLTIIIGEDDPVIPGPYQLALQVNGLQAKTRLGVNLVA